MKKQRTISIKRTVYEKAKEIARKENRSITAVVEQAIAEYMKELSSE